MGKSNLKLLGARSTDDPQNELVVIHKKSKVSYTQIPVGSSVENNLNIDEYIEPFRIQGKRLKHVERIRDKKLYIGVRVKTDIH